MRVAKKPTARVKAGTSKASAADKRKAFVEAYFANGGNALQAAITAGYAKNSAGVTGAKLLKDPRVLAEVTRRRTELVANTELNTEQTIREVARLAFSDPRNIVNEDGSIKRLNELKAGRDNAKVAEALAALTACAKTGEGNLLDLTIKATRLRATLGEISSALEEAFGRFNAQARTISGVYSKEAGASQTMDETRALVDEFEEIEGRRPRILIAKMGQDGHDRGQKVIATAFADLGFDVDVGPLFQTPEEAARQAIEGDVHVVGVSSLAAGHLTLVPALRAELDRQGRSDIAIVVGGVIPEQDFAELRQAGAAAIYPPGTNIPVAATDLLKGMVKAAREGNA